MDQQGLITVKSMLRELWTRPLQRPRLSRGGVPEPRPRRARRAPPPTRIPPCAVGGGRLLAPCAGAGSPMGSLLAI
eukprot:1874789-Alexandrium_andersonii.AAC.1